MTVHNKIKNKSFKSFQRNSSPVEHDNKIEVSQVKLTKQQKRDQKRKQQVISNNPTSIGNSNLLIKSSKKNETLTPSSENKNTISVYKRTTEYPQILPNFIGPKSRFITPSDECFTHVMDTSYKGYVTQVENDFSNDFHLMFQDAFEGLESSDVYQYDVTQPAGLGTKTAKTFVSRCLVGDAGTTYKYLGLRMFSIPWERDVVGSTKHSIMLGELNKQLIQRTKQLLKSLNKPQVGSCEYNLTLINRCYPESESAFKIEPVYGNEKCAVSWHADSTLLHYSTIAVYHYTRPITATSVPLAASKKKKGNKIVNKDSNPNSNNSDREIPWRIGLRVWYDAEGPNQGKMNSRSSEMKDNNMSPLVAIPLPNRTAYFLLDDFNHHHQHTVLPGNTHRFASTHRVCRTDGHTFQSIRQRLLSVLQDSSKYNFSAKVIRAEQLASNEVEFEWIRQYYCQGTHHIDAHLWWHAPMAELVELWLRLQQRAQDTIAILYEASCADETIVENEQMSKKSIAKRKKSLKTVEANTYDEIVNILRERNEKRHGWAKRTSDPIFNTLPANCRPVPPPAIDSPENYLYLPYNKKIVISLEELCNEIILWKSNFMNQEVMMK